MLVDTPLFLFLLSTLPVAVDCFALLYILCTCFLKIYSHWRVRICTVCVCAPFSETKKGNCVSMAGYKTG